MRLGFSLVELSIVLVILGLLTGGILAGQSLIRAAELRSIPTEFNRYRSAMYGFRDKYFAFPGDMGNATAIWGIAGGTGNDTTCRNTPSTDAKTCNGNANGYFDSPTSSYEGLRFWQQLANAGMIEGGFTGTLHSGALMVGRNIPAAKMGNAGWSLHAWTLGYMNGNSPMFDGIYDNYFFFGDANASSYAANGSILTPQEAWNIDIKIDDGAAARGKLVAYPYNHCTTATASTLLNAEFAFQDNEKRCALVFRQL